MKRPTLMQRAEAAVAMVNARGMEGRGLENVAGASLFAPPGHPILKLRACQHRVNNGADVCGMLGEFGDECGRREPFHKWTATR